jgi:hypothetical protein
MYKTPLHNILVQLLAVRNLLPSSRHHLPSRCLGMGLHATVWIENLKARGEGALGMLPYLSMS